jgi:hypothetical protein
MAIRTAPGEAVEETKVTRIIPSAQAEPQGERKPFWDFVEALSPDDWKKQNIVIHLYRGNRADRGAWCGKFEEGPFSFEIVQRQFGGGSYNCMAKKGGMLIYNTDFEIVGAPKDSSEVQAATGVGPTSEVGQILQFLMKQQEMLVAELRASRGGDTAQDAIKQALALNGQIFSSAAGTVAQTAQNLATSAGAHQTSRSEALMDKLMEAMIMKMMNPPETSGIDTTIKTISALKEAGLIGSNSGGNSTGVALVNMAPQILGGIRDTLANVARMRELEIEAMRHTRGAGAPPPQFAPPRSQAEIVTTSPVPNPPPPQPVQEQPPSAGLTFWDFIEGGIVNILSDPEKPIEIAANETLIYLDASGAAQFVDTMIEAGAEQLLTLFKTRPILQRIPQNPRLTEFIKKFLELAAESRKPQEEPADMLLDPTQQQETPQPTA